MKLIRQVGSTSHIFQIFIRDYTSVIGGGLIGLTSGSAGLVAYRHRNTDTTATAITLVSMTVGTYTSGGFKEIDSTNLPGWYQFCPPDAGFVAGATSVAFNLMGAANMVPLAIEIDLAANVIVGTNNDKTGYALSGTQTFNVTGNITGNLTGSVGSVTGAVGSVTGAVGSVTGNVGGNVVGSVASVTAPVTVGTNNDKTGYTLTSAYDAAKTAAQAGDVMKLSNGTGANQILLSSGQVTVGTNNDKTGYSLTSPQTFDIVGNITGNLSGSVGSVTAPVTVGTNNDKTGYSLSGTQTFNTTGNITGNLSGSVGSVTGAVGSVTGAVGSVTAPVTVGTNNDKTGYSLDLTQAVPTSNTAQTVGDALNAARAQGFGKWVLSGTTLTLYAANGTTVVRVFTLDSATDPMSRT